MNTTKKEWYLNLKIEVMSHYSPNIECKRCGCKNLKCLTIDHIHGDGNNHRKEHGHTLTWLKNNNYPIGYQVLCMNCNWKKEKVRLYKNRISKLFMNYPHQKSLRICDKCKRELPTKMFSKTNKLSKHLSYLNICKDCKNDNISKYREKIRFDVISHYSPEVKCKCGCNDFDVLTIDHINGDGHHHKNITNNNIFKDIIKNNYPIDKYQVLCFNCQFIKSIDDNEHHHR